MCSYRSNVAMVPNSKLLYPKLCYHLRSTSSHCLGVHLGSREESHGTRWPWPVGPRPPEEIFPELLPLKPQGHIQAGCSHWEHELFLLHQCGLGPKESEFPRRPGLVPATSCPCTSQLGQMGCICGFPLGLTRISSQNRSRSQCYGSVLVKSFFSWLFLLSDVPVWSLDHSGG